MVKPYLIELEDNDLNSTLKTKHDNQKNGHEENYTLTTGSIIINSIFTIMVIPPVAVDFLINLPDNYDYEIVLPLLARKNSNQSSRNSRVWRLPAHF